MSTSSTVSPSIPGYTHGSAALPRSPLTVADLVRIQAAALFGDDDVRALRRSLPLVRDRTEAILDVWYGFVGSVPQLVATFAGADGKPSGDYLGGVRRRFGQWIIDTARAEYDQAWLDYQHEIGRRHHRIGKNRTDGVAGAGVAPIVPFRYLAPLVFPVTATLRPFLAAGGDPPAEVDAMQAAWVKSCLVQVTLWSHPYVHEGDF